MAIPVHIRPLSIMLLSRSSQTNRRAKRRLYPFYKIVSARRTRTHNVDGSLRYNAAMIACAAAISVAPVSALIFLVLTDD
jgi:hypothetical protein